MSETKNTITVPSSVPKTSQFLSVEKVTKSISLIGDDEVPTVEEEMEEIIVPPDGGWGWIVVLASFVSNVVVDGGIYSFGLLVEPIYVATDKTIPISTITWIGSLSIGFSVLAGPIISVLANRYGFRTVAVAGSIISSLAFALAWLICYILGKPVMVALFILYGVIGGFGLGMIFLPSVVVVGFYFDKKRSLATGIAVCGSGIGTFVFPPIINAITSKYSWETVILFLAVCLVVSILCGLTYKPLKPTLVLKGNFEPTVTRNRYPSIGGMIVLMQMNTARRGSILSNLSEEVIRSEGSSKAHSLQSIPEIKSSGGNISTTDDSQGDAAEGDQLQPLQIKRVSTVSRTSRITMSVPWVQEHSDEVFTPGIVVPSPAVTSCFLARLCSQLFDCSLLKTPHFQLLCLSGFATYLGLFVPFIFMKGVAIENIMVDESSASFLISIIGMGNLVGRLAGGWIGDQPCVNVLLLNNVSITIMGISVLVIPMLGTYWQYLLCAAAFGINMGNASSLRAIILIELLGLEKLTNSFGLLLMMYGFGIVLGIPFAGLLHDLSVGSDGKGGYAITFFTAGGLLLLSAFLSYPLNCLKKWDEKRKERKKVKEDRRS